MLRSRELRCIPCRTKYGVLFTLFGAWFVVFVLFWQMGPIEYQQIVYKCSTNNPLTQNHVPDHETKHHASLTPVYIVEEHHEVLPYWFGAAARGMIPRQNNVLLHIDGHADAAPPARFNILPLFRFPNTMAEIRTMMQQNDVFIAGSAQAGLISRYIWVWPPWDTNMTAMNMNHIHSQVELGFVKGIPIDSEFPVCVCVTFDKIMDFKNGTCIHLGDDVREEAWEDSEVPRETCQIRKTVHVEVVSEDKALELLRADNWLSPLDNIILDIDEDYYGCEPSVIPLYDVGIQEKRIEHLKRIIAKLFCPSTTIQERQFDGLFYDLVQHVKIVSMEMDRKSATSNIDKQSRLLNETKHVVNLIYEKINKSNLLPNLCRRKESAKVFNILVKYLWKFTVEQLTAISKVGLCLRTSTKTYDYTPEDGMRLCDGYNRPNHSMVIFHTPDDKEVEIRTANLKAMLKYVPVPAIVTICRSIRDGYTPVKYFDKIEHDILKTLKATYDSIKYDSIYYDSDLLGSKEGLPSRHV